MSDSKPFEIRAQILHLAKDILTESMHMQFAYEERCKVPLEQAPRVTTDEVIAEAEKLYAFVSRK